MNVKRAVFAGLVATTVMTMLMLMAPLMGLPPMPIGAQLGGFLGIGSAAGWSMHFMIGAVLSVGFAAVVAPRLPGKAAVRGLVYGVGVFLLAQLVVMPMMGAGVFSGGNVPMIMGSLMGHLAFGAVLGAIYGVAPAREAAAGVFALRPGLKVR